MLTNTSTCDITIGTNQTDTLGGRGGTTGSRHIQCWNARHL